MLDTNNLYSKKLIPCHDKTILDLRKNFFTQSHKEVGKKDFISKAQQWFLDSKNNDIIGIKNLPAVDIIMGCTQFIESLALKYSWNIQVLPEDYGYYNVMGKPPTQVGDLAPGVPLIVSIPNWKHGQRPEWQDVLKECEEKDIDIHIDGAWLPVAKGITIDLSHPNIKSFATSISKYIGTWNRIGLRWCKQRSMDTVTMFNVQDKFNHTLTTCGNYVMDNIHVDYGWDTYGEKYYKICEENNLQHTNYYYVAKQKGELVSVSDILLSK